MKEFIEKLIGRLEESEERYDDVSFAQLNEFGHTLDYEYAKGKRDGVAESKEIVNQLAEEYNNDVCEWKKTDKSKYSPYYHALKHGNITLEFHDDFKFCPYCGKKIKIAPYQPKGE